MLMLDIRLVLKFELLKTGAVLTAEGSYERGVRGKAPRLVEGIKMAGKWTISYSSIVLQNPGAALRRYIGLLDVFKSLIKVPSLPPPTTVIVQWTWIHWLEDDSSSYLSLDNNERYGGGDVALSLETEEEEKDERGTEELQHDNKEPNIGHFHLADSIVQKFNMDGFEIGIDAIELIELAVQWGAMTEGTLDESLNFASLNPHTDRDCRWFTSAKWRNWTEGPGPFSRGASALLKAVYSAYDLETNEGHQPVTDTYGGNISAADETRACLEALPENWLDEMMKEVLDRGSYPPDPRPYPLGPISPHTPFGRSLWSWKHQNGSPVGRLFSRFSNHLAGLVNVGGVGVVSVAWERFMWEMRSLWEEQVSIPGMLPLPIVDGVDMLDPLVNGQAIGVQQHMRQLRTDKPVAKHDMDPVLYPPDPDPDLRLGSITQLLMLVNFCIGAVAMTVEDGFNTYSNSAAVNHPFKDEYVENAEINSAAEEDEKYSQDGYLALIPPKLSPLCPIVDHIGYKQTAIAPHVMRSVLVADMEAFLRSNPVASCGDFCTWYGLLSRNSDGEEWSFDIPDGLSWNVEKKCAIFIPPKVRPRTPEKYHIALLHEMDEEKMGHSSKLAQNKNVRVGCGDEFSSTPPDERLDEYHELVEQKHDKIAVGKSDEIGIVSNAPTFKCTDVNFQESCSQEEVDCGGGLKVVEGELSTSFVSITACWATAIEKRNNSIYKSHRYTFSPTVEAEKALHLLETISFTKLCIEALSAFLASTDFVLCMAAHRLDLIDSFPCVKESLCDLRQWMERVDNEEDDGSNKCFKSIVERLAHGCELLEIAEGCVERATAIHNSFPPVPPDVANSLAQYPCTRHIELPSGPEGSSAVLNLGKVICGANWERYFKERGGIPPLPTRREYILSCSVSGLRPMGGRICGLVENDETTQARMHAIVLEPSQALRNTSTTCQVRISTAIPEPEAMTVIL